MGTPIRLTFNELVQHTVQATVQVGGGAATAVTPQYSDSADQTTLTIEPPALGSLPAVVILTLSNVTDVAGYATAAPITVHGTYPDWIPMGSQLTASGTNLLAAGANGPVTAWVENGAVKVRIWNGSSWDAPADPITANAKSLSLITDASGAPVVAYSDSVRFCARTYGASGWADVSTGSLPALASGESSAGTGLGPTSEPSRLARRAWARSTPGARRP